jgi:5-oxoprolinase (ATP-hydrolysing)
VVLGNRYGLLGGGPGARGHNFLTYTDGRTINLVGLCFTMINVIHTTICRSQGGKNTVEVQTGDVLTILSPGGGGYGAAL